MSRPHKDAPFTSAHRRPDGEAQTSESHEQVIQRWRDLREMLIRQLDMFESGDLTLRSNNADVSAVAISDLKKSILEFDLLISG